MDDFNQYVTSVNKIFEYLEQMKSAWNSMDNNNYIDSISEYKNVLTEKSEEFKRTIVKQEELVEQTEEVQQQIPEAPVTQDISNISVEQPRTEEQIPAPNEVTPPPVEQQPIPQVQVASVPSQPVPQEQPARVEQLPTEIQSIQLPTSPVEVRENVGLQGN